MDALIAEIDRIANNTNFNKVYPMSAGGNDMTFQIGPSSGETLTVVTSQMTSTGLGVASLDLSKQDDSNLAIDTINAAIDKVSAFRADLGAAQNRLEHTIANLDVTSGNITAAESRVRDTDMADEITAFTKNNILLQAAQSMLSQSNAVPQGVLSMLQ